MTAPLARGEALLRLPDVRRRTGLGRSTIYRLIPTGGFPRNFPLGGNRVAWRESDIDRWISERIAAGS
jgi:prophage regulatory protein